MTKITKIIALLGSILIISIAFFFFSDSIIYKSVQNSPINYSTNLINDEILIYQNQYGIPKIIANNEDDLFFSIGYFQAKERLWQMDYFRRVAAGNLSEIFGKETIKFDLFFKSIDIDEAARKIYDSLSPISKKILQKYSEGVNFYIKNNKNNLSFEFGALDYLPYEWKPYHSILIGKMIAFELSLSFWIDITFGEISNKIGYENAKKLLPSYPFDSPHIADDSIMYNKKTKIGVSNLEYYNINNFSSFLRELREDLGLYGSSIGSNSFIYKSFDSINNKNRVIFANDPHLTLDLPPRWIQMHIIGGNFNVIGMTIPGIPLIISGRNEQIAFGITNMMVDDADFYIETIDSSGNYYYSDSITKQKIIFMIDSVKIKNHSALKYYKKYTNTSQIISDFHLFNENIDQFKQNPNQKYKKIEQKYTKTNQKYKKMEQKYTKTNQKYVKMEQKYENLNQNYVKIEQNNENPNQNYAKINQKKAITFLWAAKSFSDDVLSLYLINKSNNIEAFKNAIRLWGSPGLNFSYCDKDNYGIIPSGLIPKRDKNCNPVFPNDKLIGQNGWLGYVNKDSIPRNINPKRNFVASANNKTSKTYKEHISDYWEPSSRIERIYELLSEERKDFNIRDGQFIQNDLVSPYSREVLKRTMPVFEKYFYLLKNEEVRALNYLKNWNYIMNSSSKEAAIYNMFLERLINNTFRDELGEKLYQEYVFITSIPTRRILEMLEGDESEFFDDKKTKEIETREYIIFKSFRESLDSLKKLFNSEKVEDWQWGKLHKLDLNHIFSRNKLLKSVVSIENLELGGNNTTVCNTEWKYYEPFKVRVGASMRIILDLNDSIIYTSMPGGNSGDPLNPNYANQVQIWLNGGYIKIPFSKEIDDNYKLSVKFEKSK